MAEPTSTTSPATTSTPNAVRYRPDIDALRAVAIVTVVLFHAGVPGFAGGFAGVDVFFVISGFVILRSLGVEHSRTGAISWWSFYARRFRRLAPAALLMIITILGLSALVLNCIGELQHVANSAIAAVTSTSNFYFSFLLGDYFVPTYEPNVFLHTWSLAVEEQFYLGVPLLFAVAALLVRRRGWDRRRVMIGLILCACVASLVCAVVLARFAPTRAFYLPFGRVYELGIGALLAVASLRAGSAAARHIVWLTSAAALAAVTVIGVPAFGYPGAWALIPTVATAGMIWAHITPTDPGGRYWLSAPVVGVGKLSYGWYLWHWPLLSLVATWYLREPAVWVRIAVVMFALAIAMWSYRYWEPRFRISSNSRRTVLVGLLAIAITSALAIGSEQIADHVAQKQPWTTAAHAKNDTAFPAGCNHDKAFEQKPEWAVCQLGTFNPAWPSLVVWGDSYAQALLPGVVEAAQGRAVNVVAMPRSTCPPYLPSAAPIPDMPYGLERTRLELCQQHNNTALQWVLRAEKQSGVRVIIAARWPIYRGRQELFPSLVRESQNLATDSTQLVAAGTPALLARLDEAGIGFDILGVQPEMARPAPECVTRRWRSFTCDVPMSVEQSYWGDSINWMATLHAPFAGRSRVIDPVSAVCDAQTCRAQSDGVINFFDTDHLSAGATAKLVPQISQTVNDMRH